MKLIAILIAGFIGVCMITDSSDAKQADAAVLNFLGKERLSLLLDADKTESYRIDWMKQSNDKTIGISGYPILETGKALSKEQLKTLKKLISSPTSYEFQWSKRTLLRPSYSVRCLKGTDHVDILIDLESQQWGFSHKDSFVREDISKTAMPVITKILETLFKNKEVQ